MEYKKKITLDIQKEGNPKEKTYVRVVRESGGLGDVVRCLAVAQGLRIKFPEARVHFFGPTYLAGLVSIRSKAIDAYIHCPQMVREREAPLDENAYHHLKKGIEYLESHCAWCPAYVHEPLTNGLICQERTELWCEAANVPVTRPKLEMLSQDIKVMENMKKSHKKIVGMQLGSTCRSRDWPFKHWGKLIEMFRKEGYHIVIFDVCYRWESDINTDGLEMVIGGSWFDVIGKIKACDLMITPDSGFYHLTGALNQKTLGIFGPTSGQVISRIWNYEEPTHHYIQLDHDDIDHSKLPKGDVKTAPCNPICFQRHERGWSYTRYRKESRNCEIMNQTLPEYVFERARGIIRNSYSMNEDITYLFERQKNTHALPQDIQRTINKINK